MNEIQPGDRVRVVRDLYSNTSPVDDLIGLEGTVIGTGISLSPGLDAAEEETDPVCVQVDFVGLSEHFHPDELEVIEP